MSTAETNQSAAAQTEDENITAYCQAVRSGQYVRPCGLKGKYDNVRNLWEDEITGLGLRPHLERLIRRRGNGHSRLRVLDLGCGGGDGMDTLRCIPREDRGVTETAVTILPDDRLACYTGIDINPDLLRQATERYGAGDSVRFLRGDLTTGLPLPAGEPSYDLYFSSFGTFSHLNDEEAARLIADIARHASAGSLVVCDWLGRYCYEWQDLWCRETSKEQWMDYVISYIYSEEERKEKELDSFRLRLMSRVEVERIRERAASQSGISIKQRALFDRSLLVGRHSTTRDYNPHVEPLRDTVNSLFETHARTDLEALCYTYHPRPGFERLNRFNETLQTSWNAMARFTAALCERFDEGHPVLEEPDLPTDCPEHARELMRTMARVTHACRFCQFGDPRADIIEPQLGYALRTLEDTCQQGLGCGHGLVAIFEIER